MDDMKIMNFGDEDIKIAGAPKKRTVEDEVNDALEELMRAKNDGNLDVANELGRLAASHIIPSEVSIIASCGDDNIDMQKRWLCIFAAMVGFERSTPSSLLAKAAINALNNELEHNYPDIFVGSGYSTAMSFYYLAVRSSFMVEAEIGNTFAMLCGKTNDKEFASLGSALFVKMVELTESEVEEKIK